MIKLKRIVLFLKILACFITHRNFKNLMEGNVIQINGGITIDVNVNVNVKNVMYVNPVIGILLHIVAKMENV